MAAGDDAQHDYYIARSRRTFSVSILGDVVMYARHDSKDRIRQQQQHYERDGFRQKTYATATKRAHDESRVPQHCNLQYHNQPIRLNNSVRANSTSQNGKDLARTWLLIAVGIADVACAATTAARTAINSCRCWGGFQGSMNCLCDFPLSNVPVASSVADVFFCVFPPAFRQR